MTARTSWAGALSTMLLAAALGAPASSHAQSCDPTRQSCVPPGGGGGGGGGGTGGGTGGGAGGTCTAPPGGNPGTNTCGSGPAARSSSAPSTGGGNPINLVSGNKYQQEVDLPALPGVLGLELVRHYNSLDAHRGLTGANWRISYEAVLYDFGRSLQVVQADGRRLMFERPASPSKTLSGATQALCTAADPADGQVRIETDVQGQTSYHWRWRDGRTLVFGAGHNGGHPLQSIRAATGEQLTLTYAPGGELVAVRDPQGRTLRLAYDAQRQLQSITTPVNELRYRRDAQYRLIEVSTIAQDKTIATRRYHHESERQSGHANALTGISLVSVEQGKSIEQRLSTYAYDARGRAVLSTKGWPKDSKQGTDNERGLEQIDVQYLEPALPRQHKVSKDREVIPAQVGITLLTNSLGQKSQLKSAIVAGSFRLVEFTGAGCSTCPEPNKRYGYNAIGQLIAEHQLDASGKVRSTRRYEHDRYGRLTREANERAFERYEYQDTRYPDGSMALGQQPVLIARPSVIPGKEHVTRIDYNEHGQPTAVTDSGFSPVDNKGEPNAMPITRATKYAYSRINGRSVLTQIDGPLPNGPKNGPEDSDITRIEWDVQGSQATSVTRPMNLVQRFEHDDVGRLVRSTDADGVAERWFYGPASALQPSAVIRAGVATGYAYDAQGRVVGVADTSGRGIALAHDAAGRVRSVSDAQGFRQELQLDSEGKVLRAGLFEPEQLQPLRAAYRFYDAQQRLAKHLLPDGRISAYTYDEAGRMVQHSDGDDVLHLHQRNAQGLQAEIALTPDGLMRVGLGGQTLTPARPHVQRDDFGRPVLWWRPEQGLQLRVFDAAGRWVSEQQRDRAARPAGHREQEFDVAGRLTAHRVFDAQGQRVQTVRYEYIGQRLSLQGDEAQDTHFKHDADGRLVATTITLKNLEGQPVFTSTLQGTFDAQGQPTAKALADGRALRIERDATTGVARQLSLQSPAWAALHDKLGQWLPQRWAATAQGWLPRQTVLRDIAFHPYNGITGFTHGNGVRTDKRFDIAGRMTALEVGDKQVQYGYGVGPRIRQLGQQRIDYTGFGQLKEQDTAKIIKTALAQSTAQMKVEYDKLGRVVNDGTNRYTFTADGQVRTVSAVDGTHIASYRYNAHRQRVSKKVGETTTYFLWYAGKLVAEIDSAGSIQAQYLYLTEDGKAQPVAKLEAAHAQGNATAQERTLFIHTNHRGEPQAMSDDKQRVVWLSKSDAWGYFDAVQIKQQDAVLNLRVPGQYFDAESGLHDNWHRSYDPRPTSATKGRYLSPDPLGYPDGDDPYSYVNGDPINKTDATGLYGDDVHYYMTYFLARVAGLAEQEALTIARANVYIDYNPFTWPLNDSSVPAMAWSYLTDIPGAMERLAAYHFTQAGSDPARIERWYVPTPEERAAAIRAGYPPLQPYYPEPDDVYAARRIRNPSNPQLTRLLNAANGNLRTASNPGGRSPCTRAQLFGEFLHAFQDTFAHRDQNNASINNNVGLGHAAYGTETDRTYNGTVLVNVNLGAIGNWNNREARTLEAERETFAMLQRQFGTSATDTSGMPIDFSDIQAALQRFNATPEDFARDATSINRKIAILQAELERLGLQPSRIPEFNAVEACQARLRNLEPLRSSNGTVTSTAAPGVILGTPQNCNAVHGNG
jgi:RHS repeat-associated protein